MKVQIWNAYASNNSGAYTIVGSFASPEQAARVVERLAPILQAQSAWEEGDNREHPEGPSPLEQFAANEKLPLDPDFDWPQHGDDTTPRVASFGCQVLLHHPFTISLPSFFGHWFYAQGGQVEAVLEHTHNPLVVVFHVFFRESEPGTTDEKAKMVASLMVEEGSRVRPLLREPPEVRWTNSSELGLSAIALGASFEDLIAGVQATRSVLEPFAEGVSIRVFEAASDEDPFTLFKNRIT